MSDDLRCVHCGETVTMNKQGHAIGFHQELTCHKSPKRVHEVDAGLEPGEEGWVREETSDRLIWVHKNQDGSHTPATPPALSPPVGSSPHPLYPERSTLALSIHGVTMPGWFTGEACIWTGGSSPRCIGPFADVSEAMRYAETRHPGSQFFPYNKPGDLPE